VTAVSALLPGCGGSASPWSLLPPLLPAAGVVVASGEKNGPPAARDSETEGRPDDRVDLKLTDKLARRRELHDLAELGRIGIDGVSVGGDQVAVRREGQRQRPMEMGVVLEDHGPGPVVALGALSA